MMHGVEADETDARIERLLGEASRLLSHAEALNDYGRKEEAGAELARAASCEEQAASLLDAVRRDREAAVHRISAASCREQLGEYGTAVTLLKAALGVLLPEEYRRGVDAQLVRCLGAVGGEPGPVLERQSEPVAVAR
jgi:hypothetical protein